MPEARTREAEASRSAATIEVSARMYSAAIQVWGTSPRWPGERGSRQVISGLVLEGGFPPCVLQPVNFDQIYAETMRRRAQEQQAAATA